MLKITVNGQQVDLEGVKFTLQLHSPLQFSPEDGLVEGSFAFGVVFPATKTNKSIFGFPHRLEAYPEPETDYTGEMYFDGRLLFQVIISLTQATDLYFRANIKVNTGYYSSLIGDKSLRDLAYEGEVSIGITPQDVVDHAADVVTKAYPEVKYNFPQLFNDKFYGDDKEFNPTWLDRVNYYAHGSGFAANEIVDDNVVNNFYNLVPFPYLFYVLECCFREFGYEISGPVLQDPELAELVIYNNFALDLIQDRYKVYAEMSENQAISGLNTILAFDDAEFNIDLCYNSSTYKYTISQTGDHKITAHIILQGINDTGIEEQAIDYTIFMYLDGVATPIAYGSLTDPYTAEFEVNLVQLFTAGDIGKKIWLTCEFTNANTGDPMTGTVFMDSWLQIYNVSWSTWNVYAKNINIANHVPNIKVSEFLVAIQKMFGIVYHFNQNTKSVELFFIRDILASLDEDVYSELTTKSSKLAGFKPDRSYKLSFAWNSSDAFTQDNFKEYNTARLIGEYSTVEDLPSVAVEGDFAYIQSINVIYLYTDDAWSRYADAWYSKTIGDRVTAVSIECTPLTMYANYDDPAEPKVYPRISQKGSSDKIGLNDFGFHLLFHRGLKPDSLGNTYPFASCLRYGPTGSLLGNYELVLDSEEGIYTTFLETYYDFVMNRARPVDYDRWFSASEIQQINFIRKKRIFQHVFLLDELSIPISNSSIGVATMSLQKI